MIFLRTISRECTTLKIWDFLAIQISHNFNLLSSNVLAALSVI